MLVMFLLFDRSIRI